MDHILAIRLKAIGDIIFTLPAIGALRDQYPQAKITFLTSGENASLLKGFREVNEVIVLDRAALKSRNPFKMAAEFGRLLYRLRSGRYTLVVDFQGFGETAWMSRLTGASERWGSVYGKGRQWAYTHPMVRDNTLHPADWDLAILKRCGVTVGAVRNEFELPEAELAAAKKHLAANDIDLARPVLAIQPLTSTPQKNWPLENYLAAARFWRERSVQIVFIGGRGDAVALKPAALEGFHVITDLPLLVSAGIVKLATLTLGGDTGLGHLAVAQGRRVVMLMMRTNPGACVPYQHGDWAIAPPTPGRIAEITVDKVLIETRRILEP